MDPVSNPTQKPTSATQQSIRSFFQPRAPQYAAPPLQNPPTASTISSTTLPTPSPTPSLQPQATSQSSKPLSPITLPPQVTISRVEQHHIQALRRINSLLLPINYTDSFYNNILATTLPNFSRIILWTDPATAETKVVGGIVCRLDPLVVPTSDPSEDSQIVPGSYDIYIQSLALLSPYREKGLAAATLRAIIAAATQEKDIRIGELYAHVWTDNEDGLRWYASQGFMTDEGVLAGYYRRLKPDTAVIVRRKLEPSDHITNRIKAASVMAKPETENTPAIRPGNMQHSKSFQDRRPDMEWNDIPEDVLRTSLLKPGSYSADASAASSRSSSRSGVEKGGKKKRQYPAAAFG